MYSSVAHPIDCVQQYHNPHYSLYFVYAVHEVQSSGESSDEQRYPAVLRTVSLLEEIKCDNRGLIQVIPTVTHAGLIRLGPAPPGSRLDNAQGEVTPIRISRLQAPQPYVGLTNAAAQPNAWPRLS